MRIKGFRKAWRRACREAGVSDRIPHDFRRTAVRNLVRSGVPAPTAMELVGHLTMAVFRRYCIVDEADMKAARRNLAPFHRDCEPGALWFFHRKLASRGAFELRATS